MISKMNKLSFLIYHKEYEMFLEKLRELGVVHIEKDREQKWMPICRRSCRNAQPTNRC